MRRRGFTLMELLVGVIVTGVVMSALLTAFVTMWKAQASSVNMPVTQEEAQQMATTMATAFRSAVVCGSSDSGCTTGATVANCTSNSCTIYSRNSSGTLVQTTYAISGGNFQETVNGVTTTVYSNASLALTYYTSTSQYATALTSYTPTSSTTSNLIAVQIVATIAQDATSSSTYTEGNTYTTFVRLMNGY